MQTAPRILIDASDPRQTERVAALVACFEHAPSQVLIANLDTQVERVDIGDLTLPITINERHLPGNCYICDPVTGYLDYAIEETRNFTDHPLLRTSLVGLIRSTGPLLRATGLGRAVHVNNWLFSTNPAPAITPALAGSIQDAVLSQYPDHAIIMRSLNSLQDRTSLEALTASGFLLLPSRQIYLFDPAQSPRKDSVDMKRDRRLLAETPFERVSGTMFSDEDFSRAVELYNLLYLEKYTPLNPQYTPTYLKRLHEAGILAFEGLRDPDGRLIAVGGRFQVGRTLTQPIVGYDTARPQRDGLYRLVTAMAQEDARRDNLVFNMSAGAARFKRLRGAVAAIEYSAVYVQHLPRARRVATRLVAGLLTGLGVRLLQRFEL